MNTKSKPIGKTDDACKQFIIECLSGTETHGFDVDSLYFYHDSWIVFEYLKCDSNTVTPYSSNPKYYPWNWKKFYALFLLAKRLNGKLILVNYSTRDSDANEVKLMEVQDFYTNKIEEYIKLGQRGQCEYMKLEEKKMTKKTFSEWLRKINAHAGLPHIPLNEGEQNEV